MAMLETLLVFIGVDYVHDYDFISFPYERELYRLPNFNCYSSSPFADKWLYFCQDTRGISRDQEFGEVPCSKCKLVWRLRIFYLQKI